MYTINGLSLSRAHTHINTQITETRIEYHAVPCVSAFCILVHMHQCVYDHFWSGIRLPHTKFHEYYDVNLVGMNFNLLLLYYFLVLHGDII